MASSPLQAVVRSPSMENLSVLPPQVVVKESIYLCGQSTIPLEVRVQKAIRAIIASVQECKGSEEEFTYDKSEDEDDIEKTSVAMSISKSQLEYAPNHKADIMFVRGILLIFRTNTQTVSIPKPQSLPLNIRGLLLQKKVEASSKKPTVMEDLTTSISTLRENSVMQSLPSSTQSAINKAIAITKATIAQQIAELSLTSESRLSMRVKIPTGYTDTTTLVDTLLIVVNVVILTTPENLDLPLPPPERLSQVITTRINLKVMKGLSAGFSALRT